VLAAEPIVLFTKPVAEPIVSFVEPVAEPIVLSAELGYIAVSKAVSKGQTILSVLPRYRK